MTSDSDLGDSAVTSSSDNNLRRCDDVRTTANLRTVAAWGRVRRRPRPPGPPCTCGR
uniref:Uncharacterized protein n=1 Tax=Arundo donax TaxID=35708 RepID=A0A0A8YY17_ARUDO